MGACGSLFVEHGAEAPQDIVIGVVDAAKREIKESSQAKHSPTEGLTWRAVVHGHSSLEKPKDLSGKCIDLRIDELWILAPLAYCTENNKGDKTARLLKSIPAHRDGVLQMGEPFVLWRARKPSPDSGMWTVRYAGAERVELQTASVGMWTAVNLVDSSMLVAEGRRFAPEMHTASVPDAQVLAHACAVLRRYRNFCGVCDMSSRAGASFWGGEK